MSLPTPFNFSEHLFALNRGRAAKIAYLDDHGALTYGQLEDRARRFAAALKAAGIEREERVLLLQLDSIDWPVSFLGCLYAGVVPVAVNTLLTADDYAYMLEHSGSVAALVSGALLPVLQDAMSRAPHALRQLFVSHPVTPLQDGAQSFDSMIAEHAPMSEHWQRNRPITPSGSIPPARPGDPRARCMRTAAFGGPQNSSASRCSR